MASDSTPSASPAPAATASHASVTPSHPPATPAHPDLPPSVAGCQEAARDELPVGVYEYYARGAEDEVTLKGNAAAYRRRHFRPRVLRDVSSVDPACALLGLDLPSPIILAPTAFQRLCHPEGEVATARGAGVRGHLLVTSTLATCTVEEVAGAAPSPTWLQLYVFRDRELSSGLVRRAEAAGCSAICLTVDVPVAGNREHDARNHFSLGDQVEMANFSGMEQGAFPDSESGPRSGLDRFVASQFDPSLTWDAVAWLRSITDLPLVIKGIQHPEDAVLAADAGVAAVVVSNHGGRQLDGAEPTLDLLPDVVAAVQGRIPVLLDGGVRRGSDVARALCLGASAVMVGRPYLWGLTLGGADGVAHVLGILDRELERAMALLGATSLDQLTPDLLTPR